MDVGRCLNRIGYGGPPGPNMETLRALQRSFLLAVPFENLDIHLGKEIVLSSEKIFKKVVLMRRGGVCYERTILKLAHQVVQLLGVTSYSSLSRN